MNEYKISEDIYRDSLQLNKGSHKISEDIYEEAISLTSERISEIIMDSYHFSGRYWIWKMGIYSYKHDFPRMFKAGEMQIEAVGLKYLKSYPTIASMNEDYEQAHPDKLGITKFPPAYWAFANYLRNGDVVIACSTSSNVLAWGIIESQYFFKPTRKKGRHYRIVSWHKIEMPYIFTNKRAALFQIPKEETNNLKEALINKVESIPNALPFGFERKLFY
ncbi:MULTISPECIES: hypothetical protein [Segatella]|jgi:hypothetical protein|uniref:hypothetical protein n=1 Tax=Segatella TaxID=2974251 RepID=UPI00041A9F70|nr:MULTISPECIES: hypothetical protein [Segatella]MDR4931653.1 hypothetical protein [Segatella bryantii]UKK72275.1 hypothetical protein L6467_04060 [Segatella bryantii]